MFLLALKIHISESTCKLLERDEDYEIMLRGEVEVKVRYIYV